jgi:hypothetical protein
MDFNSLFDGALRCLWAFAESREMDGVFKYAVRVP